MPEQEEAFRWSLGLISRAPARVRVMLGVDELSYEACWSAPSPKAGVEVCSWSPFYRV